ncbi:hypothetical protein PR048_009684 [Dryococelus australis]|uniref:Uncharacterized protein n=1 Tax=Dryococelus australis TaxID=614101 RepID=A0ABQ9I0K3_9NEOP|nr:hypothetical protein PR048_009684 [Dryococelus australis]
MENGKKKVWITYGEDCPELLWDDIHKIKIDGTAFRKNNLRIAEIEEKMEEIEECDTVEYRKSVLNVVLIYEYFCNGSKGNSLSALCEAEALLESPSPVGVLSKLVTDIKVVLQHIVLACRAYVQFYSRKLCEVEHTDSKITFHATTLMEYGYKDNIAEMLHVRKGLSLDPNQGECHFLVGRCLGKVRHINFIFQMPAREELKELEEAMNKNPENVHYVIYLSQAYRERVRLVFLVSSTSVEMCQIMQQ